MIIFGNQTMSALSSRIRSLQHIRTPIRQHHPTYFCLSPFQYTNNQAASCILARTYQAVWIHDNTQTCGSVIKKKHVPSWQPSSVGSVGIGGRLWSLYADSPSALLARTYATQWRPREERQPRTDAQQRTSTRRTGRITGVGTRASSRGSDDYGRRARTDGMRTRRDDDQKHRPTNNRRINDGPLFDDSKLWGESKPKSSATSWWKPQGDRHKNPDRSKYQGDFYNGDKRWGYKGKSSMYAGHSRKEHGKDPKGSPTKSLTPEYKKNLEDIARIERTPLLFKSELQVWVADIQDIMMQKNLKPIKAARVLQVVANAKKISRDYAKAVDEYVLKEGQFWPLWRSAMIDKLRGDTGFGPDGHLLSSTLHALSVLDIKPDPQFMDNWYHAAEDLRTFSSISLASSINAMYKLDIKVPATFFGHWVNQTEKQVPLFTLKEIAIALYALAKMRLSPPTHVLKALLDQVWTGQQVKDEDSAPTSNSNQESGASSTTRKTKGDVQTARETGFVVEGSQSGNPFHPKFHGQSKNAIFKGEEGSPGQDDGTRRYSKRASAKELCMLLWACARLTKRLDREWLDHWYLEACRQKQMNMIDLATSIWALGTLRVGKQGGWARYLDHWQKMYMRSETGFSKRETINVLYGFGKLMVNLRNKQIGPMLLQNTFAAAEDWLPEDVAHIVWVIPKTKLELSEPDWQTLENAMYVLEKDFSTPQIMQMHFAFQEMGDTAKIKVPPFIQVV